MEGNVLALDYGQRRIGLALGDFKEKIAFPKGYLLNKTFDYCCEFLAKFCAEWGVVLIVIGWPLSMDGASNNPILPAVDMFREKLYSSFSRSKNPSLKKIKIEFLDERLSSFEAEKIIEENADFFDNIREHRDELAAMIILKRFFEKL